MVLNSFNVTWEFYVLRILPNVVDYKGQALSFEFKNHLNFINHTKIQYYLKIINFDSKCRNLKHIFKTLNNFE